MGEPRTTLLAVYDLAISRISFDFFGFLVIAEVARRRVGAERLDLLVVRADGDGFHPNVQYDLAQKEWRLTNIVLAGAHLLPSCAGVTLAASRDHARTIVAAHQGPVHPPSLSLDAPASHGETGWSVLYGHVGENLQVLRASEQARAYAAQWLDQRRGGRPAVVLTLREASFNSQRNSALETWAEFARYLERQGYFPVVLRDIERVLEAEPPELDGISQCGAAVFNLDLRLAFYERSFLSLFVSNGPGHLCFYDRDVRLLYFVSGDWLDQENTPFQTMGYGYGDTPPILNHMQRYVWREATVPAMIEAFEEMVTDLKQVTTPEAMEAAREPNPNHRRPLSVPASLFLKTRNWRLLDATLAEAERCGAMNGELKTIAEEGVRERAAIDADQAAFRRARYLKKQGWLAEATEILEDLVRRRPTELQPIQELGLCLEAQGRLDAARSVYQAALVDGVTSPTIVYRLGCVEMAAERLEDARACFQLLLSRGVASDNVRVRLDEIAARLASSRANA